MEFVLGGGDDEFFLEGELLIAEIEGALEVVALDFGGAEVGEGWGDDDEGEEGEAGDEEGPAEGADGEEEGYPEDGGGAWSHGFQVKGQGGQGFEYGGMSYWGM